MKRLGTLLALVAWVTGCERSDDPTQAPPARSPERAEIAFNAGQVASASRPVPLGTMAGTQRCVTPLREPSPPQAFPARVCPTAPKPAPELGEAQVVFLDAPTEASVHVELAETQDEQSRGLMYRTELRSDRGMLFPHAGEAVHSFWMRNTCIPLDMLFIGADNVIVGLLEQVPTLNDEPRSVACPSKYVLELNAGFARANGVKPGQRVRIDR